MSALVVAGSFSLAVPKPQSIRQGSWNRTPLPFQDGLFRLPCETNPKKVQAKTDAVKSCSLANDSKYSNRARGNRDCH